MVYRYGKGARSERELIKLFSGKGFSVIRAAGSGVSSLSPDILVFKRGKQYAFECKAWSRGRISIPRKQFLALRRWEENTGITTLVAWRLDRIGWRFMYLDEMEDKGRSFSISKEKALRIDRRVEDIV